MQITMFAGQAVGLPVGAWAVPRIVGLPTDAPGPGAALLTTGLLLAAVLIGRGIGSGVGRRRLGGAATRTGMGKVRRAAGGAVGAGGLVLAASLLTSVLVPGPIPGVAQQPRGSQVVQALDDAPPDLVGRVSANLDPHGFPQGFLAGGGIPTPTVPATADSAVRAAAAAGRRSTVQVHALGCGSTISAGSGFVTRPGFVVTNAHVVAGFDLLSVRDTAGEHDAVPIDIDPAVDIAVLAVPDVHARPIGWAGSPANRGTEGATLGFPGGQPELAVEPATVRGRVDAIGPDIYGHQRVRREILTLTAVTEPGDSGGPFVTSDGRVAGVVFAAAGGDTGLALTAAEVRPVVEAAIARDHQVAPGACLP